VYRVTAPALLYARLRGRGLSGPVLMAGGLAIVGVASYAFLAIAGHILSAADYAAISALYLLINIAGPGYFGGLEQETNRATSRALAVGGSPRLVARTAGALGMIMVGLAVTGLLAASPVMVSHVFHGNWALEIALDVGVATAYGGYLVRGLLGGRRLFRGYAATLTAEGLTRLVLVGLLAALGLRSAGAYGFIFAAALACAGLVGLPWLRSQPSDPTAYDRTERTRTFAQLSPGLALLVAATLLTQLMANLAPVVVTGRSASDLPKAAAFTSAFVLVRVPLFLFSPVQAVLLPTLTRAVAAGDRARFRRSLRLVLTAVLVVGVLGALLSATIGPALVQVLFGARVRLPGLVLGLLAVSTILLMVAQVLQPALIAAQRHRVVTSGWVFGSVALVGLLFLPIPAITAAVLAQLAGSVLVMLVMLTGVRSFLWGHEPRHGAEYKPPQRGKAGTLRP
jgi:O-antigen/teichoic acid export membrane protein